MSRDIEAMNAVTVFCDEFSLVTVIVVPISLVLDWHKFYGIRSKSAYIAIYRLQQK